MADDEVEQEAIIGSGVSLGPRVDTFFAICLHDRPVLLWTAWLTAGAAAVATIVLSSIHLRRLRRAPISLQRGHYITVTTYPIVMACACFADLLSPRTYFLCQGLLQIFEAITISTFGTILFMLVSHESRALFLARGEDPKSLGESIMQALNDEGPGKHWATPPLCCCWRPCEKESLLTPTHLIRISGMLRQWAYIRVALCPLLLWSALALRPKPFHDIQLFARIVDKCSSMMALYSLFVLYRASHKLLEGWQTTRKFVAVKLLVFLAMAQDLIIEIAVEKSYKGNSQCLMEPGHETTIHIAHFVSMYVLCLESVVLARLIPRAFTAEEVQDFQGETHLDMVELHLAQWESRSGSMNSGSSHDKEADPEEDPEGDSSSGSDDARPLSPSACA